MNLTFREDVFRANFRPLAEVAEFESHLRKRLGMKARYESARLSIGRSLAEPKPPPPLKSGVEYDTTIAGETLFGSEMDLWIATIIVDGNLGAGASIDDFRTAVEAHWGRGGLLLRDELQSVNDDDTRLMSRLAELVPAVDLSGFKSPGPMSQFRGGEVRLKVGSVSKVHPDGEDVDFVLNDPGKAPHIALMGKVGAGKTTTGVQIARQIVEQAGIPMLFIDPKGEFVNDGQLSGAMARFPGNLTAIEVGEAPIPLDFLPDADVGAVGIAQAAMQIRDSIALCCKSVGNVQQDQLRLAIEDVIRSGRNHDLAAIRAAYEANLTAVGKTSDSVISRLNELSALRVFDPVMSGREFAARSWVISLKAVPSEELKKLVILLILDTIRAAILSQQDSPVEGGFRALRHLLVIDEARKILAQKRYESLVDLVRSGRSKGQVIMLLSQDPSDFEGKADDFMTQLGTIVAFACAQSQRGLKALQGPFGRKVQPQEFSDTYLPPGVAFVKLPNRQAERIKCWSP